jgi:hypothetical protein
MAERGMESSNVTAVRQASRADALFAGATTLVFLALAIGAALVLADSDVRGGTARAVALAFAVAGGAGAAQLTITYRRAIAAKARAERLATAFEQITSDDRGVPLSVLEREPEFRSTIEELERLGYGRIAAALQTAHGDAWRRFEGRPRRSDT